MTKNTTEKILEGHAENIRNGTVMAWMDYENTIEIVATAWRENVEIQESDDSWTEVCRRPSKKSSLLRKPKCDG